MPPLRNPKQFSIESNNNQQNNIIKTKQWTSKDSNNNESSSNKIKQMTVVEALNMAQQQEINKSTNDNDKLTETEKTEESIMGKKWELHYVSIVICYWVQSLPNAMTKAMAIY